MEEWKNLRYPPFKEENEAPTPLLVPVKKINTLKRIQYSTQLLYFLPLTFYAISLIPKGWNIHISTNAVLIGVQSVKNPKIPDEKPKEKGVWW